MARLRDFLPGARDLAVLLAARGAGDLTTWLGGFRALSDDDYARIAIAQRFAAAPSFDPSGTSWLPAPFWVYGSALRLFGNELSTVRATALLLGAFATVLVFVAARLMTLSVRGAVIAGLLSVLFVPYSKLLGVAALPEVPCAALILFGAVTLARDEPGLRAFGGGALLLAAWSRYEAWPVAAVFGTVGAWDALRARRLGLLAGAALALLGPLSWIALGAIKHGEALFFVTRVTAYRRALGGESVSIVARLLEYPVLLIRGAPEISLFAAATALAVLLRRHSLPGRFGRPALALLALLGFLMLGSVRDGVPTHHAARVLLPIWFFCCLVLAPLLDRPSGPWTRREMALLAASIAVIIGSSFIELRPEGFVQRELELEAGAAARTRAEGELGIDTTDYGYFAVQAGFGAPARTRVLDDHDPRRPKASDASAELVGDAVVTAARAEQLGARCSKRWNNAGFALVRCPPR